MVLEDLGQIDILPTGWDFKQRQHSLREKYFEDKACTIEYNIAITWVTKEIWRNNISWMDNENPLCGIYRAGYSDDEACLKCPLNKKPVGKVPEDWVNPITFNGCSEIWCKCDDENTSKYMMDYFEEILNELLGMKYDEQLIKEMLQKIKEVFKYTEKDYEYRICKSYEYISKDGIKKNTCRFCDSRCLTKEANKINAKSDTNSIK